jgi:hypothetical protein
VRANILLKSRFVSLTDIRGPPKEVANSIFFSTFCYLTYTTHSHAAMVSRFNFLCNGKSEITVGFFHFPSSTLWKTVVIAIFNANIGHILFLRILYHIPYHGQKSDIISYPISQLKKDRILYTISLPSKISQERIFLVR